MQAEEEEVDNSASRRRGSPKSGRRKGKVGLGQDRDDSRTRAGKEVGQTAGQAEEEQNLGHPVITYGKEVLIHGTNSRAG